jgi:drug/metabolite transporter (DMT)-like permease
VQGISWYLACCFFASVLAILSKYLAESLSVFEITLVRGLFSLLFFVPIILKTRGKILVIKDIKINVLCGFTNFLYSYFWIKGLSLISASDATAIRFITPIITILIAILLLKEKITYHKWIGIGIGFFGMLIIIRPGFREFSVAYLLILASGIFQAFSDILVKKMTKNHIAETIVIYNILFAVIFSLPFTIIDYKPITTYQIIVFILTGLVVSLFYLTKTKAFNKTSISVVQPFDFSKLIFTAGLSYFIFGQFVDLYTSIGSVIIILGTYYEVLSTRRANRREIEKDKKVIITSNS